MAARSPMWVCHEGDVLQCWKVDWQYSCKGSALGLLYIATTPSLNMQESLHGDSANGFIVRLFIRL